MSWEFCSNDDLHCVSTGQSKCTQFLIVTSHESFLYTLAKYPAHNSTNNAADQSKRLRSGAKVVWFLGWEALNSVTGRPSRRNRCSARLFWSPLHSIESGWHRSVSFLIDVVGSDIILLGTRGSKERRSSHKMCGRVMPLNPKSFIHLVIH